MSLSPKPGNLDHVLRCKCSREQQWRSTTGVGGWWSLPWASPSSQWLLVILHPRLWGSKLMPHTEWSWACVDQEAKLCQCICIYNSHDQIPERVMALYFYSQEISSGTKTKHEPHFSRHGRSIPSVENMLSPASGHTAYIPDGPQKVNLHEIKKCHQRTSKLFRRNAVSLVRKPSQLS